MDEVLAVALPSAALIALGIWLVRWSLRRTERIRNTWRTVASGLGGTFVPASGSFWKRKSFRVEVDVGGVSVRLDYYVVNHGKSSTTYSRTTAPAPTSHLLKVYESNLFASIGKAMGMQDHVIGDTAYDDVFIIKSDDAEWARRVLDEPLRREHLRQPRLMLTVEDGKAKSVQVGFDEDVGRLTERMRLSAALAVSAQQR